MIGADDGLPSEHADDQSRIRIIDDGESAQSERCHPCEGRRNRQLRRHGDRIPCHDVGDGEGPSVVDTFDIAEADNADQLIILNDRQTVMVMAIE